MGRQWKLVLQIGAVCLVGLLLGLLGWRVADRQDAQAVAAAALDGEKPVAPAFSLPQLEGEGSVSLDSLKGKVVVLNFWASWCDPCRDEAPALQAAWEKWRDRGVVIVGVNAQDFTSDAREFMAEYGLTYPNVHDGPGSTLGDYGIKQFPETMFLDASGRIVAYQPGPVDAALLEEKIRLALESDRAS